MNGTIKMKKNYIKSKANVLPATSKRLAGVFKYSFYS